MPIQQGIEGRDSRFLRHDGSVPLTNPWYAEKTIRCPRLYVTLGGNLNLGDSAGNLRLQRGSSAEIIEIIGESNNQANLHLKNLRIADLAGVGNRNVIADVNGDLSAP